MDNKRVALYTLNNNEIELISEMHTQLFDWGPFDTPIEDLLQRYTKSSKVDKSDILQQIHQQCEFYADVLGIDETIQNLISFNDLTNDIYITLLQAIQQK